MDLHPTLTAITVIGLATSFIAGISSQIWKSSIEIEGTLKKRLTPVGWLSLGILLVGLSTSVASELIRVSIRNSEELQAKTEAAQKKALSDQESRWRSEMSGMLADTKSDIENNLKDTIKGFQDSQNRFNRTQAEIVASKQSLLESNLRHTNEIIVAGQPLTRLSLVWQFATASPALWQVMKKGQEEIQENYESTQGGVPRVPFDVMEYEVAALPLLSYLARFGGDNKVGDPADAGQAGHTSNTTVVLIPLDESQNAILSFGRIDSSSSWYKPSDESSISPGILTSAGGTNSDLSVATNLAANPNGGISKYGIGWDLDPAILWSAIDRKNTNIQPTARLPRTLKVAILYDAVVLPFQQNHFALPYTNLWTENEYARQYLSIGQYVKNAMFTIEVNGLRDMKYNYLLKKAYKLTLSDEYDEDIAAGCTVFEFEAA